MRGPSRSDNGVRLLREKLFWLSRVFLLNPTVAHEGFLKIYVDGRIIVTEHRSLRVTGIVSASPTTVFFSSRILNLYQFGPFY